MKILNFSALLMLSFFSFMLMACVAEDTTVATASTDQPEAQKEEVIEKPKADPIKKALKLRNAIEAKLKAFTLKELKQEFLQVSSYKGDGQLKKLVYSAGGDHGSFTENYYLDEAGQLVYLRIEESSWQFSATIENETVEFYTEHEFFFDNGNCVKASRTYVEAHSKEFKAAKEKATAEPLEVSKGEAIPQRLKQLVKISEQEALEPEWDGLPYLDFSK